MSSWTVEKNIGGQVVRVLFECKTCHRVQDWLDPRLRPLTAKSGIQIFHCGSLERCPKELFQ